jgi:hypothetical protein
MPTGGISDASRMHVENFEKANPRGAGLHSPSVIPGVWRRNAGKGGTPILLHHSTLPEVALVGAMQRIPVSLAS